MIKGSQKCYVAKNTWRDEDQWTMNSIDYLLSRQRKLDCCTHNRNNSTLASSVFPSNFHQNCSNYLSFVDGKFVVKLVDDNHNCRTVAAVVAAVVDSNNDAFEPASSEAAYAEEALMGLEVEYAYFVVYVTRRNLAILRMRVNRVILGNLVDYGDFG